MNQEDDDELKRLNLAVSKAIEARREFLDRKMLEYSPLKIGDEIYDLETCQCVGSVTRIYRLWRDRSEGVLDDSNNFDYEYTTGGNSFRNTSSQGGRFRFGTKEQAFEKRREK